MLYVNPHQVLILEQKYSKQLKKKYICIFRPLTLNTFQNCSKLLQASKEDQIINLLHQVDILLLKNIQVLYIKYPICLHVTLHD